MKRVWTLGLIWGLVAWVPFFMNLPFIINLTLGLPVVVAGYLLIGLEALFGSFPNALGFSLSLPTGVALTWLIYAALLFSTNLRAGAKGKKLERGVE